MGDMSGGVTRTIRSAALAIVEGDKALSDLKAKALSSLAGGKVRNVRLRCTNLLGDLTLSQAGLGGEKGDAFFPVHERTIANAVDRCNSGCLFGGRRQ